MLTIAILSLITVPVILDIALRGRRQTIELSMVPYRHPNSRR